MHKITTTQQIEPHPGNGGERSTPQPAPRQSRLCTHLLLFIFTARMSVSGDSVVVPPVQVSELRNVMSVLSCQHFQMSERCRVGLGGGTTNFLPEQTMTSCHSSAGPPWQGMLLRLSWLREAGNHRFDPNFVVVTGRHWTRTRRQRSVMRCTIPVAGVSGQIFGQAAGGAGL